MNSKNENISIFESSPYASYKKLKKNNKDNHVVVSKEEFEKRMNEGKWWRNSDDEFFRKNEN